MCQKETRLGFQVRCRHAAQSFLFTFLDKEGSVSSAAAIAPFEAKHCPQAGCGLVLSLSGVGVNPQNQADAHKYMADGKWIFGFDKAWLVTPERDGAHNWENYGMGAVWAAIEALITNVAWNKVNRGRHA